MLHGYSVGMYYSMPVLIELLLQITSGSKSSIYTNSALGQGDVNFESVVPMALLHSLVIFGGLSLGAAKIRQARRVVLAAGVLLLVSYVFLGCFGLEAVYAAGSPRTWDRETREVVPQYCQTCAKNRVVFFCLVSNHFHAVKGARTSEALHDA